MRLNEDFFARDSELVARELCRKYLMRKIDNVIISGDINITEPYRGMEKRDKEGILYPPGKIYMYFLRGSYILNISTEAEDVPACVLIYQIIKDGELLGPKKLVKELRIGKEFDGLSIAGDELYIDDCIEEEPSKAETCVKRFRVRI